MPDYLRETAQGVILALKVQPRSSKNQLVGRHNGALKVKLTAAPVDGLANKCCCDFLAKLLNVPGRNVEIMSGATARHKLVLVKELSRQEIIERLGIEND